MTVLAKRSRNRKSRRTGTDRSRDCQDVEDPYTLPSPTLAPDSASVSTKQGALILLAAPV